MNPRVVSLLVMTGVMASLVGLVVFALARFLAAARETKRAMSAEEMTALMAAAPARAAGGLVDVRAVCVQLADECRPRARRQGGDIEVRGTFRPVQGDASTLRHAFRALITQAVSRCADADLAPVVTVSGSVSADGRELVVVVSDPGPDAVPDLHDAPVQALLGHGARIGASADPRGGVRCAVSMPLDSGSLLN